MLVASVPAADDEYEAGTDGAFEEALQGSEDHEMRPVLGGAGAGYADTPTKHINRQRPSQRPSLQQEITRKLSNHIRNIKNRRQPRILLSHQLRIRPQPKNRLRGQRSFVGLLNAVAEPHEREQESVDFAEDGFVFGGGIVFGFADDDDFAVVFGRDEFEVGCHGDFFLLVEGGLLLLLLLRGAGDSFGHG